MRSVTQQALRSLEADDEVAAQLASIAQASSDAIYVVDNSGAICSWNQGAERLFGYADSEALALPSDALFPPRLRAQARELLARALAGELVEQVETEVARRDGMPVAVSLS